MFTRVAPPDDALAGLGFRLADLVIAVGTLANMQFAILKIDIGPA
ncbi:MAG: hypothetical protein WBY84_05650 [Pseudolabrys sp.]